MTINKSNTANAFVADPSFPRERLKKLLLNLKAGLARWTGQPLSFDDWGRLTGRPGNTLASWCDDGSAHQLQALMASLERLSQSQRHQLIDEACRMHPTLHHPKLAHDFVLVSCLAKLLTKPVGFTAIQGSPAHMRAFLLTALGNSFELSEPAGNGTAGIDVHRPDDFTPVLGVAYLNNPLRATEVAQQIEQAWQEVSKVKARLFLFNEVWSKVPALQPEIMALARRAHVVAADSSFNGAIKRVQASVHVLTVSAARENPGWIRVDIHEV